MDGIASESLALCRTWFERQERIHRFRLRRELGLQPAQAHLLASIGPDGLAMAGLAEELRCRRSNITMVVDRLVALGLVQRVADGSDARAKRLILTDEGAERRAQVLALHEQPVEWLGLTEDQYGQLVEIFTTLHAATESLCTASPETCADDPSEG